MATLWDIQDIQDIPAIPAIPDILDILDIHTYHMGRTKRKRKAKIRRNGEEKGVTLQVREVVVVEEKGKRKRRRKKTRKCERGACLEIWMIQKLRHVPKPHCELRQQLQLLQGQGGAHLPWLLAVQADPKKTSLHRRLTRRSSQPGLVAL